MTRKDQTTRTKELSQYMTPAWVAQEIVQAYFQDLTLCDRVLEPSCGDGAFLAAIPDHVPAVGVEIDPELAARARRRTGREVIVGDFATVALEHSPTAIIGNPPFRQSVIASFLRRAWKELEADGRAGFILPAYALKTASTVSSMARHWDIRQDMLPCNLFQNLAHPLCFVTFTKVVSRAGTLEGFMLYRQHHAVTRFKRKYRALLDAGERSVWAAVVRAAMEGLGGEACLTDIYAEIQGHRPTPNNWWKAKVRQTLQRIGVRTGCATWAIPATNQAKAA